MAGGRDDRRVAEPDLFSHRWQKPAELRAGVDDLVNEEVRRQAELGQQLARPCALARIVELRRRRFGEGARER